VVADDFEGAGIGEQIKRLVTRPTILSLCIAFVVLDGGIFLVWSGRPAVVISCIMHCTLGIWFVWARRRIALSGRRNAAKASDLGQ